MQSLSVAFPLAQAVTDAASRPSVIEFLQSIKGSAFPWLLWIPVIAIIQIISYWIASKFVIRDDNHFGNALGVFGLYVLLGLVFGLGLFIVRPVREALLTVLSGGDSSSVGVVALIFAGIAVMLWIIFWLLIPMGVYRIRFGRALVFVVLATVFTALTNLGMSAVLKTPLFGHAPAPLATADKPERSSSKAPAPRPQDSEELIMATAEKTAGDRTKSFMDRQAALTTLHHRLNAIRDALPPGDAKAAAKYSAQRQRYETLLSQVRADFAAQQKNVSKH